MIKKLEQRIAECLDDIKVKPKNVRALLNECDDVIFNLDARGTAYRAPTDLSLARRLRVQRDKLLTKLDAASLTRSI